MTRARSNVEYVGFCKGSYQFRFIMNKVKIKKKIRFLFIKCEEIYAIIKKISERKREKRYFVENNRIEMEEEIKIEEEVNGKEEVETVEAKLEGLKVNSGGEEHKLQTHWCFWYNSRVRTEKALPYSDKLKNLGINKCPSHTNVLIGEVATVEDFFRFYCYFKRPSEMPKEVDFHFFRKGEIPMWEVTYNYKTFFHFSPTL
jgi:hypothetical protein